MKYIVHNNKNIDRLGEDELLHELIKMRGVENPNAVLNLSPKVLHSAFKFNNIERALDVFNYHMTNDTNIHIIIDSDVDGITSASMMWRYIVELTGREPTFDTHELKQHGLYQEIVDRIPENTDLLIMPDASSDDHHWHKVLAERGVDVLVLDHHNFKGDCEHSIIINNQDGSYPNPHLTGVGVVFKFLDLYDEVYGHDHARNHLGLLGLGIIADLADVRDLETRFLILESLKYLKDDSKLLHGIVEANQFSIQDKITIHNVGWYVAPSLNACFRQGTREDKLDMFKALCDFEEERVFIPTRKSKSNPNKAPIVESLQDNVLRRLKSLKDNQATETKNEAKLIEKMIETQDLDYDKIIILDVTGVINATHTGLTANVLAKKYQRPVLLLTHRDEESPTYGGSARNYDKFEIDNLSEFLHRSGLIKCMGHDNSCGISLPLENLNPLKEWIEEELKEVDITPTYHVDFEIPINKLKTKHISKVGQWQDMWGGKGMSAPMFAITDIMIESADIIKNKNSIKFTIEKNGEYITFIKKFVSDEWYKELIKENNGGRISRGGGVGNKPLEITVLGHFTINKWNDRDYPQVEIVEIESKVATEGRKRTRRF